MSKDFIRDVGFMNEVLKSLLFRELGLQSSTIGLDTLYNSTHKNQDKKDMYTKFRGDIVVELIEYLKAILMKSETFHTPFSPSILETEVPKRFLDIVNEIGDEVLNDDTKSAQWDWSNHLVGKVHKGSDTDSQQRRW